MASFKHDTITIYTKTFALTGVNGEGKRTVRQNVLPSIRALPPLLTLATQASHDC